MTDAPERALVPIQIRFADVDLAQHVHNSVYLHWFELARMAYLRHIVPEDHDWMAIGLMLARNEVDYRMPVRLNDRLEAEAWCSAVGRKSFELCYRVHRLAGQPHGICAEGRSVMVCYDHLRQCTMALPDTWRDRLQVHLHK